MSAPKRPRQIHVERTADPAVLRWVPHHDALDSAPPGRRTLPDGVPLHSLAADGSIAEVAVRNGNVLVRTEHPDTWHQTVGHVQTALLLELDDLDDDPQHWLVTAVDDTAPPPTIDEVQRVVDRSAGTVFASHGGAMTVIAVDESSVVLHGEGACSGCSHSDETVLGTIGPAIRADYPDLVEIMIERQDPELERSIREVKLSPVRFLRQKGR
ncbi:MAG: hypothetical protein GY708_06625 [Actinomycetia bacterium]|nr:hypothetical protein [Actinomycetes bacterium]MCP4958550.1 hypothetical protein [Actinomycetes bacterium]